MQATSVRDKDILFRDTNEPNQPAEARWMWSCSHGCVVGVVSQYAAQLLVTRWVITPSGMETASRIQEGKQQQTPTPASVW